MPNIANLIDHVASKLPDISFVFIGHITQDVSFLEKRANVHFLGQLKYDELPNYPKAFDVGHLPY